MLLLMSLLKPLQCNRELVFFPLYLCAYLPLDAQVILVSLDAISAILSCDDENDGMPYVQMVDESGGLDRLEQLQEHENS